MFAAAPAGGAQLGQIAIVVGFVSVAYAFLLLFALAHRAGRPTRIAAFSETLGRLVRVPAWAALPLGVAAGLALDRLHGPDVGHVAAHRPGPGSRPARQSRALLHPPGALRDLRSRVPGARAGRRPIGGILLAAAGTFALDRLPARRRLAPAVRAGRDALGPDAPDHARRRGALDGRRRRAARGGGRPPARHADRGLRGAARRPVLVHGRVRLRRAAVPARPAARAAGVRERRRARRRATLGRARAPRSPRPWSP